MPQHSPWQVFLIESMKITYKVILKFYCNLYRIFKFTKIRIFKLSTAMYETLGRKGDSVLVIGTKPICESDRKVHWFVSENLFISQKKTFFHRIFDTLSRKTIRIVKLYVVLKI